jgi:hypothetical protein
MKNQMEGEVVNLCSKESITILFPPVDEHGLALQFFDLRFGGTQLHVRFDARKRTNSFAVKRFEGDRVCIMNKLLPLQLQDKERAPAVVMRVVIASENALDGVKASVHRSHKRWSRGRTDLH